MVLLLIPYSRLLDQISIIFLLLLYKLQIILESILTKLGYAQKSAFSYPSYLVIVRGKLANSRVRKVYYILKNYCIKNAVL